MLTLGKVEGRRVPRARGWGVWGAARRQPEARLARVDEGKGALSFAPANTDGQWRLTASAPLASVVGVRLAFGRPSKPGPWFGSVPSSAQPTGSTLPCAH